MTAPIAILSTGHTSAPIRARHGDFHDWIAAGLGPGVSVMGVDVRGGEAPPAPGALAGVVVTGSHDMVSDRAPWSEATAAWLREAVAAEVPVLGICYGHQLLAHAFGGHVADHPQGMELGSHAVHLAGAAADDPLFGGLPATFDAHLVHVQSVRALPAGAQVLAWNEHEPHQAFRLGRRAWGVQFHPEFSAPVMQAYIDKVRADGAARPLSAASSACRVGPTPEAASLLARFAAFVREAGPGRRA